jgi:ABC-type Fe3+-hydroxamate transport system substrate-binding protein
MEFTDQMQRTIRLAQTPVRIVSLVPSQTEFLYDIGLGDRVVGITKFCIHPDSWYRSKTRIGGTKTVHIDEVKALNPDLIIGNKEENTQADILALEAIAPVWMSDIFNLEDAIDMMLQLGIICEKQHETHILVENIRNSFELLPVVPVDRQPQVLYLIWKNPYLGAAGETFIDDMLQRCGWKNFLDGQTRYPEWTLKQTLPNGHDAAGQVNERSPDLILLSSEPYPFREKHRFELQVLFPQARIELVDGEMFSWYGSRLQHAADYFISLKV